MEHENKSRNLHSGFLDVKKYQEKLAHGVKDKLVTTQRPAFIAVATT